MRQIITEHLESVARQLDARAVPQNAIVETFSQKSPAQELDRLEWMLARNASG